MASHPYCHCCKVIEKPIPCSPRAHVLDHRQSPFLPWPGKSHIRTVRRMEHVPSPPESHSLRRTGSPDLVLLPLPPTRGAGTPPAPRRENIGHLPRLISISETEFSESCSFISILPKQRVGWIRAFTFERLRHRWKRDDCDLPGFRHRALMTCEAAGRELFPSHPGKSSAAAMRFSKSRCSGISAGGSAASNRPHRFDCHVELVAGLHAFGCEHDGPPHSHPRDRAMAQEQAATLQFASIGRIVLGSEKDRRASSCWVTACSFRQNA